MKVLTSMVAAALLLAPLSAVAAAALALGYTPKYGDGFAAFDYVNPDAPVGGRLTLSSLGTFDSLNPFVLKGSSAAGLDDLLYDTLMVQSLDEPFSLYGLIASDALLADDRLSVLFTLNPQARFADGSPVEAEDVRFSFETLTGEHAHPGYRLYWGDVERVEVVDRLQVRFHFKRVNPELHLIIASGLPILSAGWFDGRRLDEISDQPPLGSGPYLLESHDYGNRIHYRRNPDYWARNLNVRRGHYNFDEVVFTYFKDTSVRLEGLKAGLFDAMLENHSKKWAREYVGDKFERKEIITRLMPHRNPQGMQAFVLNLRRPIFADIRTRRALALAFDFEWSNEKLFYGQYQQSRSYFNNSELASSGVPEGEELALLEPYRDRLPAELFTQPWQPVSTAPPSSLRTNLRKAQQLLDEAGWRLVDGQRQDSEGRRLAFDVMLVQKGFERIVAPFAQNLQRLGIGISYRTVDLSLYERRLESFDLDMVVGRWGVSS